ncbi:MAG TPA: hypothetical protein VGR53_06650 [Nitrososphaerales archaeon]|nr:hypothetical protein [Nitrososphaerales archaeon]
MKRSSWLALVVTGFILAITFLMVRVYPGVPEVFWFFYYGVLVLVVLAWLYIRRLGEPRTVASPTAS